VNGSDWRRATTTDGGLSLLLPPDWVVEPPDARDGEMVLVAAPAEGVDPVVAVTREQVASDVSVSDFLTGNVIYLQGRQAGHRDHGGGAWTIDGRRIEWYCYSHVAASGDVMTIRLAAVRTDAAAYLTSCGALEENFARHRPTLERIARSVRPTGDIDFADQP
jgi:hypothetical protein